MCNYNLRLLYIAQKSFEFHEKLFIHLRKYGLLDIIHLIKFITAIFSLLPIVLVIEIQSFILTANFAVFLASTIPECCSPSHSIPRILKTWRSLGARTDPARLNFNFWDVNFSLVIDLRSTQLFKTGGNAIFFRFVSLSYW